MASTKKTAVALATILTFLATGAEGLSVSDAIEEASNIGKHAFSL